MAESPKTKRLPWRDFEREVAERFEQLVRSNQTAINPLLATVYHRRSYYSERRKAEIEFDIVVESLEPGATEPSHRWIIECKDYKARNVPVDDVEEFVEKLNQIGPGNIRGSMVTRVGFQDAALNYAESQRIGLFTLEKSLVRVLCFAKKATTYERVEFACLSGVTSAGLRFDVNDSWTLDKIVEMELRQGGVIP